MPSLYILPLIAILLISPTAAIAADKTVSQKVVPSLYVVLIGSQEYSSPELPKLGFAARDVGLLQQTFRQLGGRLNLERLEVLIDQPKNKVLTTLAEIASRAKETEGTTLVYWLGHSHFDELSNTLTLLPIDTGVHPSGTSGNPQPKIENGIDFVDDVLRLFHRSQRLIFVGDSCHVGEALVGSAAIDWPNLVVLSASKSDEESLDGLQDLGHGPFAYFFAQSLREPIEDNDGDGLVSVDDLFMHIYPRVLKVGLQRGHTQHPSMFGRFSHRTMLAVARDRGDDGQKLAMKLDSAILSSLTERSVVTINGDPLIGPHDIREGRLWINVKDAPKVRVGMNLIEVLPEPSLKDVAKAFNLWREANELQPFELPYKRSHAILIAVGDYERKSDPLKRGPTGLEEVTKMVSTARELALVLKRLGFETVHELYDKDATSASIDALLKTYWRGEGNDGVDRLFIYFGAHGIQYRDSAGQTRVLLATYDHDKSKMLSSNFLASDLLERHSDNFASQHAMFAIDACSAGFARTSTLSPEAVLSESQFAKIKKLQTFRDELEKKSRNVLVAGKDDQAAVTEEGSSIFALKLIEALRGKADPHNKGYWKFSDVQTWVKSQVSIAATTLRQKQQPTSWYLRAFGDGEMVFYPSPQSPGHQ